MTCLRSQTSKWISPDLNSGLSDSSLSCRNPFGGEGSPRAKALRPAESGENREG